MGSVNSLCIESLVVGLIILLPREARLAYVPRRVSSSSEVNCWLTNLEFVMSESRSDESIVRGVRTRDAVLKSRGENSPSLRGARGRRLVRIVEFILFVAVHVR